MVASSMDTKDSGGAQASAQASELIPFLMEIGAGRIRHTGRPLIDHLLGTAAILERWGAGPATCKAGLFHNVYGTEFFPDAALPFEARDRVEERIGAEAERISFVFCACERGSLFRAADRGEPYVVAGRRGEEIPVTRDELQGLLLVLWANAIEQAPHAVRSGEGRRRDASALARCAALLPPGALRELTAHVEGLEEPRSAAVRPGLATLFDLPSARPFLQGWPDQPFMGIGPVERLAGLCDYGFDELIAMKRKFAKAFFHTMDGGSAGIVIPPGEERAHYDLGHTVYFHSLRSPGMDAWISAIDAELGLVHGVTRVSAFASRRGAGLKPHYDQNDNFVCQARGTKRWRIAPNEHVRHPTTGHTVGAVPTRRASLEAPRGFPPGMPSPFYEVEMEPGSVVFMPRGTWHDTVTLERESLHFNIQTGLATWKDAVEFVIARTPALHAESLRAPVLELFEGEGFRPGFEQELRDKLAALVDALREGDLGLDREAFTRFVARRRSAI